LTRTASPGARLPAWSLFAGLIAAAGLPIYIHAPKLYVESHGVGLAAMGSVLFLLRLADVVQDPLLGWIAQRFRRARGVLVAVAAAVMAAAMWGLVAMTPPIAALGWFALTLGALFTAFSFLTIVFYAQGVAKAESLGPGGHLRLAGWREAGALGGVSLAAVGPVALVALPLPPMQAFAAIFALLALAAVLVMRGEWTAGTAAQGAAPGRGQVQGQGSAPATAAGAELRAIGADPVARRLVVLAFVNGAPVAVTSTLFLFFVESRLGAPEAAGGLLLLFFMAAAVSVPGWSRAARRFGPRPTLLAGMALSIVSFIFAATLAEGDAAAFAIICAASGAALGADMTLLPAIFARRLAVIAPEAGAAFGLWSFVSKLSLAFAAAALFPLLDASGFNAGGPNSDTALRTLSMLYAVLPCVLKLLAVLLLLTVRVGRE
jgi:GPH family glycoside/pentoside/hexuronide:cation symporter